MIKKLHARSTGPFKIIHKFGSNNAYEIELPPDLGISPTFNVSDLAGYSEPILLPSEPFGSNPILESEPISDCPLAKTSNQRDSVEQILDDKMIITRNKDYQGYMVHCKDIPTLMILG